MKDKTCGEMIRHARETRTYLTRQALAGRVGCSPAAVSSWENDAYIPSMRFRAQLFDAIKLTADERRAFMLTASDLGLL